MELVDRRRATGRIGNDSALRELAGAPFGHTVPELFRLGACLGNDQDAWFAASCDVKRGSDHGVTLLHWRA